MTGSAGRADARRNRDKLLAAARSMLGADGGSLAMESLAREAGVGVGTLYRHFPNREALFAAIYAAELDDITASAEELLEHHSPEVALRMWMDRYAAFTATKRGMLDTLRGSFAAGRIAPHTRERVTAAFRTILDSGVKAGTLRADVSPEDATTLLHGVFLATVDGDDPERSHRLLDLIADAVRAPDVRSRPGSTHPGVSA